MAAVAKPVFTVDGLLMAGLGLVILLAVWQIWPAGHPLILGIVGIIVLVMVLRGWNGLKSQWDTILAQGG